MLKIAPFLSLRRLSEDPVQVFFMAFFFSFLATLTPLFRGGMFLSVVLVGFMLWHFRSIGHQFFERQNYPFLVFIIIALFSLILYILNPVSRLFIAQQPAVVLEIISYIIIPQCYFFWLGNRTNDTRVLQKIVWLNAFVLAAGMLLHFTKPIFYYDYLDRNYSSIEGSVEAIPRLHGTLSSMAIGVVCASSIGLTLAYIRHFFLCWLMVFFFFLGAIMSFQRGAWLGASWALVAFGLAGVISSLKDFLQNKPIEITANSWFKLMTFLAVLALLLFGGNAFIDSDQLKEILNFDFTERLSSLGDAVGERDSQWVVAINALKENPMGYGYGILSHKSADRGLSYAIADGNYFRLVAELGIISVLVLIILFGLAVIRTLRLRKFGLVVAISVFMLQAIGTNVFDLYYAGFLFWFLLGLAYNKNLTDASFLK